MWWLNFNSISQQQKPTRTQHVQLHQVLYGMIW
jgi:hypothetical protein